MIKSAKAQLVAKKDGIYTTYVFKLIEEKNQYIMCTVLPNWDCTYIALNSIGFLTFEKANAGEKYYIPTTETYGIYKYSNTYFKEFLEIPEIQEQEQILII